VTRFGLIRHAETLWNRQRRIQGRGDSPLTPEGKRMAAFWGRLLAGLPWDRILASDTGRALATARRIQARLGRPLALEPRLRELDWGAWTGRTLEEIAAVEPERLARQAAAGWEFRPPGGESRRELLARVRAALAAAARRHPGERVLVVTHGGVLRALELSLSGDGPPAAEAPDPRGYRILWVRGGPEGRLELEGVCPLGGTGAARVRREAAS